MKLGDRVINKKFGKGVILDKTEDSYWILFENYGVLRLGLTTEMKNYNNSSIKVKYKELTKECVEELKNIWKTQQITENVIQDYRRMVANLYKELDLTDIKIKDNFTKDDLKSWMILELRSGDLLQYHPYGVMEEYKNGWAIGYDGIELTINEYNNDLTEKEDSKYDIVKIHRIKDFNKFDEAEWLDRNNMELVREL